MRYLFVIDYQKDFVDGALGFPGAEKLDEGIAAKIRQYQKNGDLIVQTMDTHHPDYLSTREGKHLPVLHCLEGSDGWQLHSDIAKLIRTTPFDKPTFGSLELAGYLKDLNDRAKLEEVELIGLCTDICVISNAMILKAAFPDVPISVDGSCCAGVTMESHRIALDAMKAVQIEIKG